MDYLQYTLDNGGGTFGDMGVFEVGERFNPRDVFSTAIIKEGTFKIHRLFRYLVNPIIDGLLRDGGWSVVGTWIDKDEPEFIQIDVVALYYNLDNALTAARLSGQKAIFNLRTGETINVE